MFDKLIEFGKLYKPCVNSVDKLIEFGNLYKSCVNSVDKLIEFGKVLVHCGHVLCSVFEIMGTRCTLCIAQMGLF